jgi:hypothetical protein
MRGKPGFVWLKSAVVGCAAAGVTLSIAATALAISVVLPPGGSLATPPTTAATEPDLAGVAIHDALLPFTIKAASGAVLCTGQLQDRVVRSSRTQRLHFYYRIRDTRGTGAIVRMATASFAGPALRVGYRTDGLGTVPPRLATRTAAPGTLLTFAFTDPPVSCAQHQESRFVLIKTVAASFHPGGATRLIATTGAGTSVPTVMP